MLRRVCAIFVLMLAVWLAGAFTQAADAPAEATVTDAENKEVKLTDLKFGTGTHRLSWLADPNATTEDGKKGPLVLEVREPYSTSYLKGVVTYIPVASIESIKYDYEKQFASVSVKGVTDPVTGTLQYKNINVLNLSGTAEGKPITFSGGAFAKGNIKAVAFPDAKPLPARKGASAWQVQIDQPKAMNPTLKVGELKFIYQFPGGDVLADALTVHKADPLKFDAVKSYTTLAVDPTSHVVAAEAQVGDADRVVVIMPTIEKDGKTGTLVGAVGEVEAGWKMFPLSTIKNMKRPKKD
jgi:hypothetical protein